MAPSLDRYLPVSHLVSVPERIQPPLWIVFYPLIAGNAVTRGDQFVSPIVEAIALQNLPKKIDYDHGIRVRTDGGAAPSRRHFGVGHHGAGQGTRIRNVFELTVIRSDFLL